MQFNSYFLYFCYIAWNWNPILALFIIYYEITGERKYHIGTIGINDLKGLARTGVDISHASIYMPVNYFVLERLMNEIVKYNGNKTFLDLGCGRGRVMIVAAHYGFKEIRGIDFAKNLCEDAETMIRLHTRDIPAAHFTVLNCNATDYDIPDDLTSIFLFNPFDEVIMKEVLIRILKSLQQSPRTIRILYANPVYKSLFLEEGFAEIYHIKKLGYFEGSILEKSA